MSEASIPLAKDTVVSEMTRANLTLTADHSTGDEVNLKFGNPMSSGLGGKLSLADAEAALTMMVATLVDDERAKYEAPIVKIVAESRVRSQLMEMAARVICPRPAEPIGPLVPATGAIFVTHDEASDQP